MRPLLPRQRQRYLTSSFQLSESKGVWSLLFLSFFDKVFGSPVCFERSVTATSLGVLLIASSANMLNKLEVTFWLDVVPVVVFFWTIIFFASNLLSIKQLKFLLLPGVGYNSLKQLSLSFLVLPVAALGAIVMFIVGITLGPPVNLRVVMASSFFFLVNAASDYVALQQTRFLLDWHVSKRITTFGLIEGDLTAKLLIFVVSVAFVYFFAYGAGFTGSDWVGQTTSFPTGRDLVIALIYQDVNYRDLRALMVLSLFTTILATAWLVIFLTGRYFLSVMRRGAANISSRR